MFNNMLMGAAGESIKATSFSVDNSAVFNKADAEYLAADSGFGTPSNADVGTISMWFKRGNLGGSNLRLFTHGSGASVQIQAYLTSSDTLVVGNGTEVTTTQVFRDPHAWYNLVIRVDTSQGTSSNRVRHYLNGSQITDFSASSYPSQNADVFTSTGWRIGSWSNSTTHTFDGYMSEVVYCDGQSLGPTSFGETDDNGVWRPIDVSELTFGSNGFYLNMAASGSDLGDDASGNSNDFTNTNSVTQTTDSPTNNAAILSPLWTDTTLSNGNLKAVATGNAYQWAISSIAIPSSGKWTCEFQSSNINGSSLYGYIGIAQMGNHNNKTGTSNRWGINLGNGEVYNGSGTEVHDFSTSSYATTLMRLEYDADADTIKIFSAGSEIFPASTGASATVGLTGQSSLHFFCAPYGSGADFTATFKGLSGTPTTGYKELTTANLLENSTPAIEDGSAHFQTSLWSGNSSSQTVNQSGNSTFTPDKVWTKDRNFGNIGNIFDAVRAQDPSNKGLAIDTGAEDTNSDGITFGSGSIAFTGAGNTGDLNTSGRTYVGWQWLAGNATSTPSGGSVSSTVSVNQTAGFSIVSWTGTGANATVAHGLGATPQVVIVRNRSGGGWYVGHASAGFNYEVRLDESGARAGSSTLFNETNPTSTVFTVGTAAGTNGSTNNMIAYCWCEKPGFSAFGSYEGNGNATNGPYVHLGFTPQWLMIKGIDQSANSWMMYDNAREPNNPKDLDLAADTPNAEDVDMGSNGPDFLSNGFKFQSSGTSQGNLNVNNKTFIYMAFAENPFAGTTPATAR